jgi:hypothetical protein
VVDGIHARDRADNRCPANIEKHLTAKGNDGRAYRGPKKTHGGSSFCGVRLPPEAPIVPCCGCIGFAGSTPAIEAIQLAMGGEFVLAGETAAAPAPAAGACAWMAFARPKYRRCSLITRGGAAVKLGSKPVDASPGLRRADFNCESVKGW